MENTSQVARFIRARIQTTGKKQAEIAREVGFDKPNMISMIKLGHTKLPLAKVGPMAKALGTNPVALLKICLSEYCPETWKEIAPYMEASLTEEERRLVSALRTWIGAPYLAALSEESKDRFEDFIQSLRLPAGIH